MTDGAQNPSRRRCRHRPRRGQEALAVYASDFSVYGKDDGSPVTEADRRAESVILERLPALVPGIPIVSEEQVAAGRAPDLDGRFWLVDPLDGTKEFIKRNGEFTINIALVAGGRPVLGVVLAPAAGRLYAGAEGFGARVQENSGSRRPIACRRPPAKG